MSYLNIGILGRSSLEIQEENNYYPFGLKHEGYNSVVSANANAVAGKFKYNGIEMEEGLGLNLYEMEFRQYDPAIGRFTSIDPVTHFSISPYAGFDNNPIFWADPSGADSIYNFDTHQYVINGQVVSYEEALSYAQNGGNADGTNNNTPDEVYHDNSKGKDQESELSEKREYLSQDSERPAKIDLNGDPREVLNSLISWAIYIREHNEEEIYLSDIMIFKIKNVTFGDVGFPGDPKGLQDTWLYDGKGNKLRVAYDTGYIGKYQQFGNNEITQIVGVYFKGQLDDSNEYHIRFEGPRRCGNCINPFYPFIFMVKGFMKV